LVLVDSTRKGLQDIGAFYRKRLDLPIVAVTGSVGKTSTREMISAALAPGYEVFCARGNYNGQLGVPMTLGEIGRGYTAAVIEMGMSLPGEMEIISRIARVDVAVFTNIGVSHIENLGSRDRICMEKLHITDGMPEDGLLVLNGDDDMLRKYAAELPFRKVWYGLGETNGYRAENVRTEDNRAAFSIAYRDGRDGGAEKRIPVKLSVPGIHNVQNCLAAVCAAAELGIPVEKAVEAVEAFHGFTRRLELKEARGIRIIDDSYNASPDSMKAALQVLCSMEGTGKKIAVLADMWELGEDSPLFHRQVGAYGASLGIGCFYLVGERARDIGAGVKEAAPEAEVLYFDNNADAADAINRNCREGDILLLKGSNGMHLGEILEAVEAWGGGGLHTRLK